jgi:hypothetical protein
MSMSKTLTSSLMPWPLAAKIGAAFGSRFSLLM